jgi:Flp pilus assembly protein TadD
VGLASTAAPGIHNARVLPRSLVRLGLAALCAAGVAAGVVTYRSEKAAEDARTAYLSSRPSQGLVDRFEDARPLNPDVETDVGEATALLALRRPRRAEDVIRRAAAREPDNARIWAYWATLALSLGKRGEAQQHWNRARELNPRLPVPIPPPR